MHSQKCPLTLIRRNLVVLIVQQTNDLCFLKFTPIGASSTRFFLNEHNFILLFTIQARFALRKEGTFISYVNRRVETKHWLRAFATKTAGPRSLLLGTRRVKRRAACNQTCLVVYRVNRPARGRTRVGGTSLVTSRGRVSSGEERHREESDLTRMYRTRAYNREYRETFSTWSRELRNDLVARAEGWSTGSTSRSQLRSVE